MDLVLQTAQTIRDEKLLSSGAIVVIAVSGGPDSMALLHVMHRLSSAQNYKLIVAHVNHQFRGAESEQEAEAVEEYARTLSIPFRGTAIDVPAYVRKHGGNTQAAARQLRYQYLHEVAEEAGAAAIALAHHADDQVETVVMNMLRGSSPSGLIGMLMRRTEKNMKLIRPFLRIPKERLVAYCQDERISFYLDSSNMSRKYTRNRIRLDIIPQLLDINPKLPEAVDRMAEILREEDQYLNEQTNKAAERIVHFAVKSCSVSRKSWLAEPVALQRRLIKLILHYIAGGDYSSDFVKIESIRLAIDNDIQPSWTSQIDSCVRIRRSYDHIEWLPGLLEEQLNTHYEYNIESSEGDLWIPEAEALLKIHIESSRLELGYIRDNLMDQQLEACFDAEQISFPLTVRSRRIGDRIELLGLNGSKKVKDMFIDLKIIQKWRDQVPLIVDHEGRILWIPGIGRSRHGLIHSHTSRLLRMQLYPSSSLI